MTTKVWKLCLDRGVADGVDPVQYGCNSQHCMTARVRCIVHLHRVCVCVCVPFTLAMQAVMHGLSHMPCLVPLASAESAAASVVVIARSFDVEAPGTYAGACADDDAVAATFLITDVMPACTMGVPQPSFLLSVRLQRDSETAQRIRIITWRMR